MQLRHVNEYHAHMQMKGANMQMMTMTKDDGTPYKTGWVVSGYAGPDSHKYVPSKEKAKKLFFDRGLYFSLVI